MEIRVIVINKVMLSSWHCLDVYLFQQDIRGKTTETIDSKLINRLKPRRNHSTLVVTVKNSNFIHTGCFFHLVLRKNSSIRLISEMETEFFLSRVGPTPPLSIYV